MLIVNGKFVFIFDQTHIKHSNQLKTGKFLHIQNRPFAHSRHIKARDNSMRVENESVISKRVDRIIEFTNHFMILLATN